jgi:hypothetical protein
MITSFATEEVHVLMEPVFGRVSGLIRSVPLMVNLIIPVWALLEAERIVSL